MPEGEIEVAVQAEGTDEAVGEMGAAPDVGGPDVGGRGGDGGGGAGAFGKLLAKIAGLVVFLGPIFDVLGAVANVLTAFVAPLAVVLLRLLQPVLRLLIAVLPVWFDIMEIVDMAVQRINELRKEFINNIVELLGIKNLIQNLPTDIGKQITGLAEDIGNAVADNIPGINRQDVDTATEALTSREAQQAGFAGSQLGGPVGAGVGIVLQGGLSTLVDRIEKDGDVDLP
jgi:hypothetical protein